MKTAIVRGKICRSRMTSQEGPSRHCSFEPIIDKDAAIIRLGMKLGCSITDAGCCSAGAMLMDAVTLRSVMLDVVTPVLMISQSLGQLFILVDV